MSIHDKLHHLKMLTTTLLNKAHNEGLRGAINWADLKVVDVRFSVGIDNDSLYQIYIEEVAPDEYELHKYLYNNLPYDDIEIHTEW